MSGVAINQEDRKAQVFAVIAKIEDGMSENAACGEVGINRATFRAAALRFVAGDDYARSLSSLAQAQVEDLEKTLTDLRSGEIDHNVARIIVDARKWFASKFLPKMYGDKTAIEHGGHVSTSTLTPEQEEARIAELAIQLGYTKAAT